MKRVMKTYDEKEEKTMNSIGFYEEDLYEDTAELPWDAGQVLIEARRRSGMTQQALSRRSGIRQSVISRLERGNGNPSVKTLQRLAEGMGMRLELTFVPEDE